MVFRQWYEFVSHFFNIWYEFVSHPWYDFVSQNLRNTALNCVFTRISAYFCDTRRNLVRAYNFRQCNLMNISFLAKKDISQKMPF